jgi:hypothetical protein
MAYKSSRYSGYGDGGTVDAGWGLIFRINDLWRKADGHALDGDLDKWNFVLDRIFCNLCYRNQMEITLNEKNELVKINLTEKDELIFKKFSEDIKKAKMIKANALRLKRKSDYDEAQNEHYRILMMKDIWLRKFMNELGLYLKEVEKNPATAMFGGG